VAERQRRIDQVREADRREDIVQPLREPPQLVLGRVVRRQRCQVDDGEGREGRGHLVCLLLSRANSEEERGRIGGNEIREQCVRVGRFSFYMPIYRSYIIGSDAHFKVPREGAPQLTRRGGSVRL
jgi:hypothetical protein